MEKQQPPSSLPSEPQTWACLFIGGPMDGQREVLPQGKKFYEHADLELPSMVEMQNIPLGDPLPFKIFTYEHCAIRWAGGRQEVMIPRDLEEGQVYQMLCEGYRQPKEKK